MDPVHAAALLDAYGPLLTERQRQACELVFNEDWSLAEAAAALSVSRARVSALVAGALRHLRRLEDQLKLVQRQGERRALLDELSRLAEQGVDRAPLADLAARFWRLEGVDADV